MASLTETIHFDPEDYLDEVDTEDLVKELKKRGEDLVEELDDADLVEEVRSRGLIVLEDKKIDLEEVAERTTGNLADFYRMKSALELFKNFSLEELEKAKAYLEESSMKVTGFTSKRI